MNDGLLYRSLPAFTGLLVFMPACSSNEPNATDTDGSTGSSSESSGPSTTSPSTTEPSETGTSEGSESGESTETGPTVCPDDSMCADSLPEGWLGPLIMARVPQDGTPPECPEEFPAPGPALLDGLLAPGETECTCECQSPGAPNCYASVVSSENENCSYYYYYYEGGYGGGGNQYYQVSEQCSNVNITDFARFNLFGGYNPGSCTAEETEHVPPVTWEAAIKTCELPETPLSCNYDGICIPPPAAGFEQVWCLYQQGDAGCPAGVFNTKHKFYTGVEDSRGCSDCTCGSSPANCASGELMIFEGPDCAGEPTALMEPNNQCEPTLAGSVAVNYGNLGECPVASAPHPEGTAEPVGDFTFCCTG